MENVLGARRFGQIDALFCRSFEFRTIHRQLERLLRRHEGHVPNLEKPRAIPRSGDRVQPLFKLRLNVVEYL